MERFLKSGISFFLLLSLLVSLSGCKKSLDEILTTEKWKVYSGGREVIFEFNKDGTGQQSNTKYNWEINDDKLTLTYDDSHTVDYTISDNDGVYQLKRYEEEPLYSGEFVLTREKDFEKLYDFEDRLMSKAEFDVFLIYNSNFSNGNFVEVFVMDIKNFGNIYTVSGKAKYTENYHTYTGTFEIQYEYDGEEIQEIDNYFSRPN